MIFKLLYTSPFLMIFFLKAQNLYLRLYVPSSPAPDSADFPLHLDPTHKSGQSFLRCGNGKIIFHKVYQKNDSLYLEVEHFPVLFHLSWKHAHSEHYGFWTHALKSNFKGTARLVYHTNVSPFSTKDSLENKKFYILFNFRNPQHGIMRFFRLPSAPGWYAISIESPSGDFGHIHGYFKNDSLFASSFNGSSFFILKGILRNNEWKGVYLSENGQKYTWHSENQKENNAEHPLHFTFPSKIPFYTAEGKPFFPNIDSLKNHPIVLHLLGSWCHNCRDEVLALKEFVRYYSPKGVRFLAWAVEKQSDTAYVHERIRFVKERWHITWPVVYTSLTTKDNPSEFFGLNEPLPYPTLFVFDKEHKGIYFHKGFSGPATGPEFEKWKIGFGTILNKLLQE